MALSRVVTNGTIMVYMAGATPPPPPVPVPNTNPGDMPRDQRIQGYPQARGFMVIHQALNPDMGVSVDELTQP